MSVITSNSGGVTLHAHPLESSAGLLTANYTLM